MSLTTAAAASSSCHVTTSTQFAVFVNGMNSPHSQHISASGIGNFQGSRRKLLLSFPFLLLPLSPFPSLSSSALSASLEQYVDPVESFTLLVPSTWSKVEKAGATALFEEQGKGSNNIGIVVNPVRLDSLRDFGTPQFVADKLIQAERRKIKRHQETLSTAMYPDFISRLHLPESTKQAEVIAVSERSGHGGIPVYEFEYTVDSTRGGMKRIFSAAFVASKKLYLLNIVHSDSSDNPLDDQIRLVLEKVLHSFDTTLS